MRLEFEYRNLGPPEGGLSNWRSNWITLVRSPGRVEVTRQYIRKDGTRTAGIKHDYPPDASPATVAVGIHWGCCGWSANSSQLAKLAGIITPFLEWKP